MRLVDSETAHSLAISALSTVGERPAGQYLLNRLYKTPELPITPLNLRVGIFTDLLNKNLNIIPLIKSYFKEKVFTHFLYYLSDPQLY